MFVRACARLRVGVHVGVIVGAGRCDALLDVSVRVQLCVRVGQDRHQEFGSKHQEFGSWAQRTQQRQHSNNNYNNNHNQYRKSMRTTATTTPASRRRQHGRG